jgi:hypothetical protein
MDPTHIREALRKGELTLGELKGITAEELAAGLRAGRRLMEAGEHRAAAEVLAGLALYDPYRPEVWRALEELLRRTRHPAQARLFGDLARVMAS